MMGLNSQFYLFEGLGINSHFAAIKIERNDFHGDWNYRIRSG